MILVGLNKQGHNIYFHFGWLSPLNSMLCPNEEKSQLTQTLKLCAAAVNYTFYMEVKDQTVSALFRSFNDDDDGLLCTIIEFMHPTEIPTRRKVNFLIFFLEKVGEGIGSN